VKATTELIEHSVVFRGSKGKDPVIVESPQKPGGHARLGFYPHQAWSRSRGAAVEPVGH